MESTINQQAAGLQVFFNEELGTNIRIKMIGEEPWFMGKDVCIAAGIGKYRDALSCLDSDERMSTNMDTPGGNQQVTAVNESGMYHLVFQSRKPEAKAFRKWVTGVVLPSTPPYRFLLSLIPYSVQPSPYSQIPLFLRQLERLCGTFSFQFGKEARSTGTWSKLQPCT